MHLLITLLMSLPVFASPSGRVVLERTPNHAGPAFETVITGAAAKELFLLLTAEAREVESSDGRWLNKRATGILCGKNLRTGRYYCSLVVDSNGVQY
jgi:hypothetical protein